MIEGKYSVTSVEGPDGHVRIDVQNGGYRRVMGSPSTLCRSS
ncbi:hypothetical protein [Sphingobium sp. EP60837]|nr:hypothetical protein [Sphingobium sp. EP60837]